jgi:hypothetical protein
MSKTESNIAWIAAVRSERAARLEEFIAQHRPKVVGVLCENGKKVKVYEPR